MFLKDQGWFSDRKSTVYKRKTEEKTVEVREKGRNEAQKVTENC